MALKIGRVVWFEAAKLKESVKSSKQPALLYEYEKVISKGLRRFVAVFFEK